MPYSGLSPQGFPRPQRFYDVSVDGHPSVYASKNGFDKGPHALSQLVVSMNAYCQDYHQSSGSPRTACIMFLAEQGSIMVLKSRQSPTCLKQRTIFRHFLTSLFRVRPTVRACLQALRNVRFPLMAETAASSMHISLNSGSTNILPKMLKQVS